MTVRKHGTHSTQGGTGRSPKPIHADRKAPHPSSPSESSQPRARHASTSRPDIGEGPRPSSYRDDGPVQIRIPGIPTPVTLEPRQARGLGVPELPSLELDPTPGPLLSKNPKRIGKVGLMRMLERLSADTSESTALNFSALFHTAQEVLHRFDTAPESLNENDARILMSLHRALVRNWTGTSIHFPHQPLPPLENPQYVEYLKKNVTACTHFLEALRTRPFWKDQREFESVLDEMHALQFYRPEQNGSVRTYEIPEIASEHDRPLILLSLRAQGHRLQDNERIELEGVPELKQSVNLRRAFGSVFFYPSASSIKDGAEGAREALERLMTEYELSPETQVDLVGRIYRSIVATHRYARVNHGLAMNITNALLSFCGFSRPLEHGALDMYAMYAPPEIFQNVFRNEVARFNPSRLQPKMRWNAEALRRDLQAMVSSTTSILARAELDVGRLEEIRPRDALVSSPEKLRALLSWSGRIERAIRRVAMLREDMISTEVCLQSTQSDDLSETNHTIIERSKVAAEEIEQVLERASNVLFQLSGTSLDETFHAIEQLLKTEAGKTLSELERVGPRTARPMVVDYHALLDQAFQFAQLVEFFKQIQGEFSDAERAKDARYRFREKPDPERAMRTLSPLASGGRDHVLLNDLHASGRLVAESWNDLLGEVPVPIRRGQLEALLSEQEERSPEIYPQLQVIRAFVRSYGLRALQDSIDRNHSQAVKPKSARNLDELPPEKRLRLALMCMNHPFPSRDTGFTQMTGGRSGATTWAVLSNKGLVTGIIKEIDTSTPEGAALAERELKGNVAVKPVAARANVNVGAIESTVELFSGSPQSTRFLFIAPLEGQTMGSLVAQNTTSSFLEQAMADCSRVLSAFHSASRDGQQVSKRFQEKQRQFIEERVLLAAQTLETQDRLLGQNLLDRWRSVGSAMKNAPAQAVLIHADPNLGNFMGSEQGVGLIDFGDVAHWIDENERPQGVPEFDVARLIETCAHENDKNEWGFSDQELEAIQQRIVSAYEAGGDRLDEQRLFAFRLAWRSSHIVTSSKKSEHLLNLAAARLRRLLDAVTA